MKTCYRCKTTKPDSEFYRNGQDNACKPCRKVLSRAAYEMRKTRHLDFSSEPSTQQAYLALKARNIPCCTGHAVGRAWIDLMAWACVPIEAKSSKPLEDGRKYKWSFTEQERKRGFDGIFLFMAETPERTRYFVIPCETDWIQHDGVPVNTAVTVTFDSDHFNARYADLLLPYEDRFDLIEVARLRFRA